MNETEWLACGDPLRMLGWLDGRGSDRKLRLFVCGCLRRLEAVYRDHDMELLPAVEAAERRADALPDDYKPPYRGLWTMTFSDREMARELLGVLRQEPAGAAAREAVHSIAKLAAIRRAEGRPYRSITGEGDELSGQARILRDIFGHLFYAGPPPLARNEDATQVTYLARGLYDGRSYCDTPILADALMEAGCDDASILGHLRSPGPHVRGCWALDLVLGKE